MNPVDLLPILLIFGVMYFLVVRPQVKEKQDHEKLLSSLVRDDRVVTSSGIHGRVVSVEDELVVIEVSDKSRVTFDKKSVARRQADPPSDKK